MLHCFVSLNYGIHLPHSKGCNYMSAYGFIFVTGEAASHILAVLVVYERKR
jgi:hypothetical protein